MNSSVTELPFNTLIGIESTTNSTGLLRLPAGSQYLNHLGTVHASALLALAEASSGEFLLRQFGSATGVIPVVRRLEAKFRKAASGAVTSTISTAPAEIEQLRGSLSAKARAFIEIQVELHDESGGHVLSATVEWFMTRAPAAGNVETDD